MRAMKCIHILNKINGRKKITDKPMRGNEMDLVAVLPGCVENGMSSPFGASYLDLLAF